MESQLFVGKVNALLEWITDNGQSVIAELLNVDFTHEADKKFYEVAKFCQAKLITGNIKHFPNDEWVLTVSEFLEQN